MKVVRWIVLVLVVLALLVLGVGLLLPSDFEVKRSAAIAAPPEKVYALVENPRHWAKWTVWNRRDPAMKMTYSGSEAGQGAGWSWESATEGNGTMVFTRAEPPRRIDYELSFPEFGMTSQGELLFDPHGGGTRVTWTNRGDVGANPLNRYFAVMMDRMVGPDFEQGLANLKALAEKP